MTQTLKPPAAEIIHLSEISWSTYNQLLEELSHRRFRLTYHYGYLEIMTPSPEHELSKEVLGRFVETLAEELNIKIYPLGSTTLKKEELSGAEPDKCFYINNIEKIRGKKRLDLNQDPAPDLVIEIDLTSSSQKRLEVYANLGVKEIWIYNGQDLLIKQWQNGVYISQDKSRFFTNLPIREIAKFLEQAPTTDYLELISLFRNWLREERKKTLS